MDATRSAGSLPTTAQAGGREAEGAVLLPARSQLMKLGYEGAPQAALGEIQLGKMGKMGKMNHPLFPFPLAAMTAILGPTPPSVHELFGSCPWVQHWSV